MTYSQLFGWCNPALVMTRRTTTHPKCMGLWVIYVTAGRAVLVHSSHGEWQRDDKRTILSLLCVWGRLSFPPLWLRVAF
jgi:hypothetical protein